MPGGTLSSSAAMSITPRSASSAPSQRWTAAQFASISRSACTSWPQSRSEIGGRVGAELGLERVREAVRGVGGEDTVRSPAAAQRRAVAAATLVLPTPPLPV